MPIAEIISVGTELLFGEILDSNAAFLAQELAARGVTLHRKTVIGDNVGRLQEAILAALNRADLVILGGGLGPTDDDLTREAIAAAVGETPAEDPELLAWLRGLFEARGRFMPEINRKQAWLIPSAQALPNPVGTAPGWLVRTGGKMIVAMPGPPREMQKMWREQVLPLLPPSAQVLRYTTLHTHGIGESDLAELLGDLTRAANPSIGTYARKMGVDVRVAASGPTAQEAEALLLPTLMRVRELLAEWIWGEDDQTLAAALQEVLGERTLGVVEAGTAGALASLLARQPCLAEAMVTQDKARLHKLGLSAGVTWPLADSAACEVAAHELAARELATGAREHLDVAVGLSVVTATGEQTGQGAAAIDTGRLQATVAGQWLGTPEHVRERAAVMALALAYRTLRQGGEA